MVRIDHNVHAELPDAATASTGTTGRRSGTAARWLAARTEFDRRDRAGRRTPSYYGNGFYQRISTHHAHQQFDWIIKPNLLNHSTVAYDRWFMGGNSLSAGAGWPHVCWLGRQSTGGMLAAGRGPATDRTSTGNIPYNQLGQYGWPRFGFLVNNRWQFSDDLTWVKGRHTLKTGFEFRHHDFPFRGWAVGTGGGQFQFNRLDTGGYDASGNNLQATGDPFASFLLGQVFDVEPDHPRRADVQRGVHGGLGQRRVQGVGQADADARAPLRLPVGAHREQRSVLDVRPEHAESRRRRHIPARSSSRATVRAGPGRRTFENPNDRRVGPARRLRLSASATRTCFRGGYGIYYARRRVRSVRRAADARLPGEPARAEHDERLAAGVLSRQRLPGRIAISQPPFIDPTFANGGDADRGGVRRPDAAAVPELVRHLPASADRAT